MVREILKIYTDNGLGNNNPTFKGIELSEYSAKFPRMGMPSLSATLMWPTPLDNEWTRTEYVVLRGERFYIRHTPSGKKDNKDSRYSHEIEFTSEFAEILGNTYFEDFVPDAQSGIICQTRNKPCSNSSSFTFYGTLTEFCDRLNCSFLRSRIGDSILNTKTSLTTNDVPVGDGFCVMVDLDGEYDHTKTYEFSFEDKKHWEAITEGFNITKVPFERRGRRIIFGAVSNTVEHAFDYGHNNELLSIYHKNANAQVINRITMFGSDENIPHYYPNETEYGHIGLTLDGNKTIKKGDISIDNPSRLIKAIPQGKRAILCKTNASQAAFYNLTMQVRKNDSAGYEPYNGQYIEFETDNELTDQKLSVKCSFELTSGGEFSITSILGQVWIASQSNPSVDSNLLIGKIVTIVSFLNQSTELPFAYDSEQGVLSFGELDAGGYELNFSVAVPVRGATAKSNVFVRVSNLAYNAPYSSQQVFWDVDGKKYSDLSIFGVTLNKPITDNMIGDGFGWSASSRMPFQTNLVPSKYRDTLGAERFYNAINDTYIDPDTGNPYNFPNPYIEGAPSEYIYRNEDIKPTIEGVTNASGQLFGVIADIAYDADDNDDLKSEATEDNDKNDSLKYEHSFFYIKLNIFDGDYGFDLFAHASQTDPMTLQMTSGNCNGCKFKIQVLETVENGIEIWKNPVQATEGGEIASGNYEDKVKKDNIQTWQQNTKTHSIWICVQKDAETFGVIMPNQSNNFKPAIGDKFNIINIDLPQGYILAAEKRLEEDGIRFMADNNEEKFTFEIAASRIFFAERPDVLAQIDEYSKIKVWYNGKIYEQYINQLSIDCKNSEALPDIGIELTDTLAVGDSFIEQVAERASSLIANPTTLGGYTESNGGGISAAEAERRFLSKKRADRSPYKIASDTGFEVGDFVSGGSGGIFYRDPETGQTYIEADKLKVRMKAIFEELEIAKVSTIGGKFIITPGGGINISFVEELTDSYRCYFKAKDEDKGAECRFIVGDQVQCHEFNVQAGTHHHASNRYYWRLVTSVNNAESYIELSKTDCDNALGMTSDAPQIGDTIVQLGNRNDTSRQSAIILSTVDAFAPCVTLYNGINHYSLDGKAVIEYGVDKTKTPPEPFFNCYGRFYFGPKDRRTYLEYNPALGELEFRGRLSLQSAVGSYTFEEYVNYAAESAAADLQAQVDALQAQVDGVIEAFNGFGAPTLNNYPANEWTTDEERRRHDRDIYTDITPYVDDVTTPTSGQSWKWYYNSPTDYGWTKIADSEAVKALQLAQMSVMDVDTLFIQTNSPTDAPALPTVSTTTGQITDLKGWSTDAPAWQDGMYMWQCTYTRYGDGGATFAGPTCISGATGQTGQQGPQGVPGAPGIDGKTYYTWIRYANDANGSGISNSPVGKAYIGFAYNKTTATESNNPADYTWSEIKGEQGVPGVPGIDGKTYYTWIKYSDNANGSGMYDTPNANTKYIGIAVNKLTQTEGTNPADYTWSLFRGENGSSITITTQSVKYSTVHTASQPADSTFTLTAVPTLSAGQFLWSRTYVEYSNGQSTTSYAVSRVGEDGAAGASYTDNLFDYTSGTHTLHNARKDGNFGFVQVAADSAARYVWWVNISKNGNSTNIAQKEITTPQKLVIKFTISQASSGCNIYFKLNGSARDTGITINTPDIFTAGDYTLSADITNVTNGSVAFKNLKIERGFNDNPQWTPAASEMLAPTITATSVTYAKTTASTQPADTAFTYTSIGAANVGLGDYLWTKTVVTYSDGSETKSYSVGRIGSDGDTTVAGLHIAYASAVTGNLPNPTAVTGFSTTMFSGAKYIGIYTDDKEADSTNFQDYEWALFKGEDGAPAKLVVVNADATAFVYKDDFATLVTPASIGLSATLQGTTGYQWSFKRAGQSAWTNITDANGGKQANVNLTPNGQVFGTGMDKSATIRCTSGGVYDEVTIVKVSSGSNGEDGSSYSPNIFPSKYFNLSEAGAKLTKAGSLQFQSSYISNVYRYNFIPEYCPITKAGKFSISMWAKVTSGTATINADINDTQVFGNTALSTEWVQIKGTANVATLIGNYGFLDIVVLSGTASDVRFSDVVVTPTDAPLDSWVPTSDEMIGEDAYTVLLTNESHIFEGDTEKAVAASTTSQVIAYKGATQVAANIGTITGMPTGMTVAITNNGKTTAKFTVTVNASLTTKQGTLTVPVTVDGKTFTQVFSWSLSLKGKDGRGISSIVEEYALSATATAPASSAFSTTIPTMTDAQPYLWNREKTTYTDNTSATTTAVMIGVRGQNGDPGATVVSVTNYYLASASASGVTTSTSGWTTNASASAATISAEKPYLWNYEVTKWSKGADTSTTPHVVGKFGKDFPENLLLLSETQVNNGNYNIANYYFDKIPVVGKPYTFTLWGELAATKTAFRIYNSGDSVYMAQLAKIADGVYSVSFTWSNSYGSATVTPTHIKVYTINNSQSGTSSIQKVKLEEGSNSDPVWTPAISEMGGPTFTEQYYLSTSNTALSGGSWQTTVPTWSAGKYIWTRTRIDTPTGKTTYTDPVCTTGATGAAAPNLVIQYSADATNWHAVYAAGDIWMRTSNDGGSNWGAAVRIQGSSYSPNLLIDTEAPRTVTASVTEDAKSLKYNLDTPIDDVKVGDKFAIFVENIEVLAGSPTGFTVYLYINGSNGGAINLSKTTPYGTITASKNGVLDQVLLYAGIRGATASNSVRYTKVMLVKGDTPAQWCPAASEMLGTPGADGPWRKFQWAKNTSTTTAPTSGWADAPMTASAGEYVWMRSGLVVPPATAPATWETAVRLTGDTGAAGKDTYRLDLSNEVAGVACNAAGTVTGTLPTSNITVYKGATVDSGWTFAASSTGCSAYISGSKLFIAALSANAGTATVTATKSGYPTLQATMSVYKVKPGEDGSSYSPNLLLGSKTGYVLTYADSNEANTSYSSTTNAEGFLEYTMTALSAVASTAYYRYGDGFGILAEKFQDGETYTLSLEAKTTAAARFKIDSRRTGATSVELYVEIPNTNGEWKRFSTTKVMNDIGTQQNGILLLRFATGAPAGSTATIRKVCLTKGDSAAYVPAESEMIGEDAVVYSLETVPDNITRNALGNLSADYIDVTKYRITGASPRVATTDKILKLQFIGIDTSENIVSPNGGVASARITVPKNCTAAVFTLYDTDGAMLDRERVPIIQDAPVETENIVRDSYIMKTIDPPAAGTLAGQRRINLTLHESLAQNTIYTFTIWGNLSGSVQFNRFSITSTQNYTVTPVKIGEVNGVNVYSVSASTGIVLSINNIDILFNSGATGEVKWVKIEKGTNKVPVWNQNPEDNAYLRRALNENTTIDGGLILTSLIQLGYTARNGEYVTTSGINGIADPSDALAVWTGGEMIDKAKKPTATNAAKSAMRHDGTAYFCNNTVRMSQSAIDVGDNVTLGASGLSMKAGNSEALRIGAVDVETLAGTNANETYSLNNKTISKAFAFYKTNGGDQCIAVSDSMTTVALGFSAQKGMVLKGTLSFSATPNLTGMDNNAEVPIYLDILVAGNVEYSMGVHLKTTNNGASYSASNFSIFLPFNNAGAVTARLYGMSSAPADAEEAATGINCTATFGTGSSADYYTTNKTVLGANGFLAIWGGSKVLLSGNGIELSCGNYGFRILSSGFQIKRGSNTWSNWSPS